MCAGFGVLHPFMSKAIRDEQSRQLFFEISGFSIGLFFINVVLIFFVAYGVFKAKVRILFPLLNRELSL
jgi:hypothetical protein